MAADEMRQARSEVAAWLRRVPDRIQPDPRRWTAVGWANAVASGAFALLAVLTWRHHEHVLVVTPVHIAGRRITLA